MQHKIIELDIQKTAKALRIDIKEIRIAEIADLKLTSLTSIEEGKVKLAKIFGELE